VSVSDKKKEKKREHRNKEGVYPLTRCVFDPSFVFKNSDGGAILFKKIGRDNGVV